MQLEEFNYSHILHEKFPTIFNEVISLGKEYKKELRGRGEYIYLARRAQPITFTGDYINQINWLFERFIHILQQFGLTPNQTTPEVFVCLDLKLANLGIVNNHMVFIDISPSSQIKIPPRFRKYFIYYSICLFIHSIYMYAPIVSYPIIESFLLSMEVNGYINLNPYLRDYFYHWALNEITPNSEGILTEQEYEEIKQLNIQFLGQQKFKFPYFIKCYQDIHLYNPEPEIFKPNHYFRHYLGNGDFITLINRLSGVGEDSGQYANMVSE